MIEPKEDLFEIIKSAIDSAKPAGLFKKKICFTNNLLCVNGLSYELSRYKNIYVVGAGKASAGMAESLENIIGDRITCGLVSVNEKGKSECKKIRIIEASHPVIDQRSKNAAEKIIKICSEAGENDLVICLISGGGSSLIEKLPPEISVNDYINFNEDLIKCGADIIEINTVRKKLSLIKGGKLAQIIYPAECLSLIISDVIGDDIGIIASGLTAPDKSKFEEALYVIRKYNLTGDRHAKIIKYLLDRKNEDNAEKESYKNLYAGKIRNVIIGNNDDALIGAEQKAKQLGYNAEIINGKISGEARDAALEITAFLKKTGKAIRKPACLLFGGETTVTVKGNGKGGRNQEFVLAALTQMTNFSRDFLIASIGTDGIDGTTDAAGAFATNRSYKLIDEKKMTPQKYLNRNDSYSFFKSINGLIITGSTGTNAGDIILAMLY